MKKYIILLFAFTIVISCKKVNENVEKEIPQKAEIIIPENGNSGKIKNLHFGCAYNYTLGKSEIILNEPKNREIEQSKNLLAYNGIPMNFEIFSADISNAGAIIIDNKRYILYDPKLFLFTDQLSNTYWSSMSILAHEIGHHLSGHTLSYGSDSHKNELEADKYSGFLLYKMGATLDEATISIKMLASENDSESHPSKYKRISAIESGWNDASQQRYESAIPPPPSDENDNVEFWGQSEFFKEELIYEQALTDPSFRGSINEDENSTLEGIIINVDKDDPSGGHFAEHFNEIPTGFNMEITIHLTYISNHQYSEKRKVGQREKFCLLEYGQMNNASLSALEAVIVPGRKIRFKSIYFGYGEEQIFYLKKLNRNK